MNLPSPAIIYNLSNEFLCKVSGIYFFYTQQTQDRRCTDNG